MNRAIATLLMIGLTQTTNAAELYAVAGMGQQFRHGPCRNIVGDIGPCAWDRDNYAAGIAHIEIGASANTGRFTFQLYGRHESLTGHHDYGVNQVGVDVRVTLFKRN